MRQIARHPFFLVCLSILPLLFLFSLACGEKTTEAEYYDTSFFAMDTYITLRLGQTDAEGQPLPKDLLQQASKEGEDTVYAIEKALSATDPAGEVYALNQNIDLMANPSETLLSAVATAFDLSEQTGGAFDPTLGALVRLWNVTGGGPVPPDDAIRETLVHTGLDKIKINGHTLVKSDAKTNLDLGGIGKGFAAQELLQNLMNAGIPYGLVSLGGNIGVFGEKPDGQTFKIGVRDPDAADSVVGYLYLTGGFVSVSGDYERYFEEEGKRYHHILDPVTGYPAESGLRSVACWSPNGACADALSTALFVMGVERGLAFYQNSTLSFEAVFLTDDGNMILTDGLVGTGLFEAASDTYRLLDTAEEPGR